MWSLPCCLSGMVVLRRTARQLLCERLEERLVPTCVDLLELAGQLQVLPQEEILTTIANCPSKADQPTANSGDAINDQVFEELNVADLSPATTALAPSQSAPTQGESTLILAMQSQDSSLSNRVSLSADNETELGSALPLASEPSLNASEADSPAQQTQRGSARPMPAPAGGNATTLGSARPVPAVEFLLRPVPTTTGNLIPLLAPVKSVVGSSLMPSRQPTVPLTVATGSNEEQIAADRSRGVPPTESVAASESGSRTVPTAVQRYLLGADETPPPRLAVDGSTLLPTTQPMTKPPAPPMQWDIDTISEPISDEESSTEETAARIERLEPAEFQQSVEPVRPLYLLAWVVGGVGAIHQASALYRRNLREKFPLRKEENDRAAELS